MLRLSNAFLNRDILSLRTGGKIGKVNEPIINPNNLRIEGWRAVDISQKNEVVLPSGELRDFIPKGLVVNDHDSLTQPEDLVRLKPILEIEFSLIGKSVVTESKKRMGKVGDYSVDDGFYVQKLYVTPSLLKGLKNEQLIISRDSIIEITDKKIIIKDASVRVGVGATVAEPA